MIKKNAVLITAIVGLFLLICTSVIFISVNKKDHEKQLNVIETQKEFYTGVINSRDSLINETLKTFDTIEKELNLIKEKEHIITINSSNNDFSQDKKNKILNDIAYIGTLLENNKRKIAKLNDQLKKFGVELQGLKDKIAQLETDLQQRQIDIIDLKNILEKKEVEISELNNKVNEQQLIIVNEGEIIANQTFELNKAFVVYGTKKELLNKGIINKSGGFLGLGRKENLTFSNSLFKQVDLTQLKSIPVNSKNAKLVTDHPVDSYEFKYDGKMISSIEINNPSEFWKASKYVVIQIR